MSLGLLYTLTPSNYAGGNSSFLLNPLGCGANTHGPIYRNFAVSFRPAGVLSVPTRREAGENPSLLSHLLPCFLSSSQLSPKSVPKGLKILERSGIAAWANLPAGRFQMSIRDPSREKTQELPEL